MAHSEESTTRERRVASASAVRPVLMAAVTVGLAIMGDSLMYSLLPLEAPRLGIALPLVGLLLSANRIVRLISNTVVGAVFARMGPRIPFLAATVLALATTLAYGWAPGVAVFLLARVGWGVAWSALRQGGFQAVWAGDEGRRGQLMGVLWGTIRLGSAISVMVGGLLYDRYGYRAAIMGVAGLTALSLPLAWRISWPREASRQASRPVRLGDAWRVLRPPAPRWAVLAGGTQALLEATLVSTASLFLTAKVGSNALLGYVGTAAGALLAVRWLGDLVFGPLFGALSDRIGQRWTALGLAGLAFFLVVGPVQMAGLPALAGLGLVFICNAGLVVTLAATANSLALRTPSPHLLVGLYTTAVDVGLAAGPLIAYVIGARLSLPWLYVLVAGALLLVVTRVREA